MSPSEEAAAILTRVLEAICRLNNKTLSVQTRADLQRVCELLTQDDGLDVLEDLPEPRRSPAEAAIEPGMADFQRWKARRYVEQG